MFCSTLQQHLGETGKWEYTYDRPRHPDLFPTVRERVRKLVLSEYPVLFYGEQRERSRVCCPRVTVAISIRVSELGRE